MASMFATIFFSLSFGNVLLLSLLLLLVHYLTVIYEFRKMPPGPRTTTVPVLGNVFSLNFKAEKLTDVFQRLVIYEETGLYLVGPWNRSNRPYHATPS